MKETRIFQIKKKALENNIALRVFYNEFSIYIGYFLRRSGPAYSLGIYIFVFFFFMYVSSQKVEI